MVKCLATSKRCCGHIVHELGYVPAGVDSLLSSRRCTRESVHSAADHDRGTSLNRLRLDDEIESDEDQSPFAERRKERGIDGLPVAGDNDHAALCERLQRVILRHFLARDVVDRRTDISPSSAS